jgi:hypothetical protein
MYEVALLYINPGWRWIAWHFKTQMLGLGQLATLHLFPTVLAFHSQAKLTVQVVPAAKKVEGGKPLNRTSMLGQDMGSRMSVGRTSVANAVRACFQLQTSSTCPICLKLVHSIESIASAVLWTKQEALTGALLAECGKLPQQVFNDNVCPQRRYRCSI